MARIGEQNTCPTCKAQVGQKCTTGSGKVTSDSHQARIVGTKYSPGNALRPRKEK